MSIIHSFAKSGMWDFQSYIAPAAVAIPLAVEGVGLIKNICQNPAYLKEKIVKIRHLAIDSFTRREGEATEEAVKRIVKNIFITLSCVALMSIAAYLSLYLLPATIGISTAISAIVLIGKLFINAKAYKERLIQAFTVKPDENPLEAKKRIRQNILKVVAIAACLGAAIALGAYILIPLLHKFSWSVSLPFQNKIVVFLEYAILSVIHTCMAINKYRKGDKAGALFHLIAAISAIAFPIFYWNNDMRLHHSFYGLALMALPSRTAKFIGSLITFDSSLYMLEPLRGGYNAFNRFIQYDFINIIVDHFPLFYNGYTAAALLENVHSNWPKATARNKNMSLVGLEPTTLSLKGRCSTD